MQKQVETVDTKSNETSKLVENVESEFVESNPIQQKPNDDWIEPKIGDVTQNPFLVFFLSWLCLPGLGHIILGQKYKYVLLLNY